MIDIITPKHYLRGKGALSEAGKAAAAFGGKIFIIGGKTALEKAGPALLASFDKAGIQYEVREYSGYPNHDAAKNIAREAKEKGFEAFAAVGGGRITDTAKSAGAEAGLPVIAVPTIAATCASFAAVTIMYTKEGVFTDAAFREKSPELVIADTDIIAEAPVRYLRAGIADSLAKWYEAAPGVKRGGGLYLHLALKYGELIREILESKGAETAASLEKGSVNETDFNDVLDSVFLITGLCGSIVTIGTSQGIAHPLYNALSHYPELRKKLHGEKVAFGFVSQGILGNEDEQDIIHRVSVLKQLKIPLTFEELGFGIDGDIDTQLAETAERVKSFIPVYKGLDRPYTADDLVRAMKKADSCGRSVQ